MRIAKITMEFAPVCKCINANSAFQVNEMYQFGLIKTTAVIVPPPYPHIQYYEVKTNFCGRL